MCSIKNLRHAAVGALDCGLSLTADCDFAFQLGNFSARHEDDKRCSVRHSEVSLRECAVQSRRLARAVGSSRLSWGLPAIQAGRRRPHGRGLAGRVVTVGMADPWGVRPKEPETKESKRGSWQNGRGLTPIKSHFVVFSAPPILEPILLEIGMFTGVRGFDASIHRTKELFSRPTDDVGS